MKKLKQVWIYQFRKAHEDDCVSVFGNEPSRKALDDVLMHDICDFKDNNTTPEIERNNGFKNVEFYDELYTAEIQTIPKQRIVSDLITDEVRS